MLFLTALTRYLCPLMTMMEESLAALVVPIGTYRGQEERRMGLAGSRRANYFLHPHEAQWRAEYKKIDQERGRRWHLDSGSEQIRCDLSSGEGR